jgi:hypothetical protein
MPFITPTVLDDLQATGALNEKRKGNYGMIDLVHQSTKGVDYVPPSVQAEIAKISGARGITMPYMKDQTVVVNSSPSFTIPSNMAESGTFTVLPFDVFSGYRDLPAAYDNNVADGAFWNKETLSNVLQAMAVTEDNLIETILEANKSQVLDFTTQVSQGGGVFDFGSDILSINKAAQKDTMFPLIKSLMASNKLGGQYSIVTSPGGLVSSVTEAMKYQGEQSKYLEWAQSDMPFENRHESNQLSPASDNFTGFYVRNGAIGMYNNYPYDFRIGTKLGDQQWGITNTEMPFLNTRLNFFINQGSTNAESMFANDTNMKMTTFTELGLWHRFYLVVRPITDRAASPSDIVKIKGLTT